MRNTRLLLIILTIAAQVFLSSCRTNHPITPDNVQRLTKIREVSVIGPILYISRIPLVGPLLLLSVWRYGAGRAVSIVFSPDGELIATGHENPGEIRFWSAASLDRLNTLRPGQTPWHIALNPRWAHLVAVDTGPGIGVWDFEEDGSLTDLFRLPGQRDDITVRLTGICFSPNGELLAATATDGAGVGMLYIWDMQNGKIIGQAKASEATLSVLDFSPDGKWILTGSYDLNPDDKLGATFKPAIKLWRVPDLKECKVLEEFDGSVWDIDISEDGKFIAAVAGSQMERVFIWDATSLKQVAVLVHDEDIGEIEISPDGSLIICLTEESHKAYIWAVKRREVVKVLKFPTDGYIALSPDGKALVFLNDLRIFLYGIP